ncbi:MAG: hypothetical protein J6K75_04795, partial [Erysipelotrichaceae bacterium]|nr:hypothetical protein [Erysipelotrichaceae bacterium]
RHLYDLYKLSDEIVFNDEFFELFQEVKSIRATDEECLSAKSDQNLKALLTEICHNDFFKKDYEEVTKELLFEEVSYISAKNSLINIIANLNE